MTCSGFLWGRSAGSEEEEGVAVCTEHKKDEEEGAQAGVHQKGIMAML